MATAITWSGPAQVECDSVVDCPPGCPLPARRARAYESGSWTLYGLLEDAECVHASPTSETVCGWSGTADVESDGHEMRWTCPRCQTPNTQPSPDGNDLD